MREFQQHQLTPAKLRALARRDELSAALRDKLNDLALLHEALTGWLREHDLQDANCLLDAATEALKGASPEGKGAGAAAQPVAGPLRMAHLWLDGFAEMTPQELDLLAAVLRFTERATFAFCLDAAGAAAAEANGSWLSLWNAVGRTYAQCRHQTADLPDSRVETEILARTPGKGRFAKSVELARLEEQWPHRVPPAPSGAETAQRAAPAALSVTACANPAAEAAFAAREILKFARAGNRFRDCAILVRNLDDYHQPLARAFRGGGIPFFLDRRESAAHHPLAELTRGALRTAAFDWRHDDWFAALKSGLAPATEGEIDRLENAALESGWRGKKWRDPLPEEALERIRRKIAPPFETFAAELARAQNEPTGAQLAGALRGLWDDLGVEQTLETWSAPETETPPPAGPERFTRQCGGRCWRGWTTWRSLSRARRCRSASGCPSWTPAWRA